MTAEKGSLITQDCSMDKFPVGMRVLAVDDNTICLKILENLLRKCQYQVTATNQATTALKMLREEGNKYDLVISDVDMPDMDGFKLLELVGLEMDLPVIMLSGHSDTRLVMKGITHGACDYLLKPVRIEELKNIWQHVVRRKKFDSREQNKSSNREMGHAVTCEGGEASTSAGNSTLKSNGCKKRMDQGEAEEEDVAEKEDPTATKKPRVVWSLELHQKFVAAVNHLGFENAVPKKILDLMNVEGLTRENVASHLQKHRLYLKRITNEACQQANMIAAYGTTDPSYLHVTHKLDGTLPSTALSSYKHGVMPDRLNTASGFCFPTVASPSLNRPLTNSMATFGNFESTPLLVNQNVNLLQGTPTSLELNHLAQRKTCTQIGGSAISDRLIFAVGGDFHESRVTVGRSSNSTSCASSPLMLQGNACQTSRVWLRNQSSPHVNIDYFERGLPASSNSVYHSRCNARWQKGAQLSKYPSNTLLDNTGNNLSMNNKDKQQLDASRQDYNHGLNGSICKVDSLVAANGVFMNQSTSDGSKDIGVCLISQANAREKAASDSKMMFHEDYLLHKSNTHDSVDYDHCDSLDNTMRAAITGDENGTASTDTDFGFNAYPLGSCR